jgi:hypothetical protein
MLTRVNIERKRESLVALQDLEEVLALEGAVLGQVRAVHCVPHAVEAELGPTNLVLGELT